MYSVVRRTRHTLAVVTLALAGCQGPLQSPTATPEVVPLYFITDSSTNPLLQDLATAYQRENDLIAIVNQFETGPALQTPLNQRTIPYTISTFAPLDADYWAAPLGYEGIAIITNPGVFVERLTAQDLREIFSGTINDWATVGGRTTTSTIVLVSREDGAAIRSNFQELVMGQRPVSIGARLATTPESMLEIVATTPGAIGYVELSMLNNSVNAVPIAEFSNSMAISISRDAIANGSYPLQMPVLVIGESPPKIGDGYYEFILWAQQGEGRSIINRYYVPVVLDLAG